MYWRSSVNYTSSLFSSPMSDFPSNNPGQVTYLCPNGKDDGVASTHPVTTGLQINVWDTLGEYSKLRALRITL